MITIQESCDYAVSKIVEQGGRCVDKYGDCDYVNALRTKHCGVGWVLELQGVSTATLCRLGGGVDDLLHVPMYRKLLPEKALQYLEEHTRILQLLQGFHDATYAQRKRVHDELVKHGIDTSGPDWQTMLAWGDL